MNSFNILIIEAYTDANIGSGALVENTVEILRGRYPYAKIRVMAHYPDAFEKLCQVEAVEDIFRYPFGKSRFAQIQWLMAALVWILALYAQTLILPRAKVLFFKNKVEDFLWADLVISVGAERINDKFIKNIFFSLYTYLIVKRLGRPMVLFPCTVGPFLFKLTRWLTSKVLKDLDLIYTRDDLSFKMVCELSGVKKESVVNTSDVAVIQNQADHNHALKMIGKRKGVNIVGISVMRWTYVANAIETPYSNYDSYVREMARFADALVERYGVSIVFYPTNFPVHGCREDDVGTARKIFEKMRCKTHAHIIETLPTPSMLKGMLSCSKINITTRMHACIFSTGAFVPTISVNYLFKLKEYMESIGLGDFSIDIEMFNEELASAAFERLWKDRQFWRNKIKAAMSEKQRKLIDSMVHLDALIPPKY